MTVQELEVRIMDWARRESGVEALIQIGSRVQPGAEVDEWSDCDYHLIVQDTARFLNTDWLGAIAPYWGAHIERTERGVAKISVIFAGGLEVDFVPLSSWQMKLVYLVMAFPTLRPFCPRVLVKGIYNTRLIVRPGYKILIGGVAWQKRLTALTVDWPEVRFTAEDFRDTLTGFWRHAVWVHKKTMRGEVQAARRWFHAELVERRWVLLAEEARLAGRPARPEARKAERWLDTRRLEQTAITTSPDRRALAKALLAEMALFEEVSRSVAQSRGFTEPDYAAVAAWLRAELSLLAELA